MTGNEANLRLEHRDEPLIGTLGRSAQAVSGMGATETAARSWLLVLALVVILSLFYVASFGPMTSVAVRTNLSIPTGWTIYRPIPVSWQIRMLRFWGALDPNILFLVNQGVGEWLPSRGRSLASSLGLITFSYAYNCRGTGNDGQIPSLGFGTVPYILTDPPTASRQFQNRALWLQPRCSPLLTQGPSYPVGTGLAKKDSPILPTGEGNRQDATGTSNPAEPLP